MKTLPEKLETVEVAQGDSASTGGRRKVFKNEEFGVTVVVTWPPGAEFGLQAFTCKDLPLHSYNTYEKLRTAYAKHWSAQ